MSLPLSPIDIFSTGCHPSQTARLLVSSYELELSWKISSVTLVIRFAETRLHLSYLLYVFNKKAQQQVAVKVYKVLASH